MGPPSYRRSFRPCECVLQGPGLSVGLSGGSRGCEGKDESKNWRNQLERKKVESCFSLLLQSSSDLKSEDHHNVGGHQKDRRPARGRGVRQSMPATGPAP